MAMLVLLFGLPRLLVLCSDHASPPHVTFAHAPGACCHHDHGETAAPTPDDGTPAARPHAHCAHHELSIELATAPRSGPAVTPPTPAVVRGAAEFVLAPRTADERPERAAATGPPRPDPRLRLRTTTRLLL